MSTVIRALASVSRVVAILWVVITVVFISLRLTPGDPAVLLLGPTAGRQDVAERLEQIRERYGLNRPVFTQYVIYLRDVVTGNLGASNRSERPVIGLIAGAAPVTISLTLLSLVAAIPIAILLGMIAAQRRDGLFDRTTRTGAMLAMAVPSFWVGLLLLNLLGIKLHWLPASGYVSFFQDPVGFFTHMCLPVFTLALYLVGALTRYVYTETVDTLEQDYITVARAMGIRPREILFRFAAKNSLTPMIIVIGVETGTLIGGAVIVEEVFGLPGIGRLMLNAVLGRDYPVVQGSVRRSPSP
jgi:peptide/nickel transport system permease protein